MQNFAHWRNALSYLVPGALAKYSIVKKPGTSHRSAIMHVPVGSSADAWFGTSDSVPSLMNFGAPSRRSGTHICSGKHGATTTARALSSRSLASVHRSAIAGRHSTVPADSGVERRSFAFPLLIRVTTHEPWCFTSIHIWNRF